MKDNQVFASDILTNLPVHSGFIHNGKKYNTHTRLPFSESAFQTLIAWQKVLLAIIIFAIFVGIVVNLKLTLIIIIAILTLVYSQDLLFSIYILIKSLEHPPEVNFNQRALSPIDEENLPIYSILCTLYKEAKILPQFVEAIGNINWPDRKLDVLLLLEEDDRETINCAYKLNLPS